jgi:hypothetical protein
MTYVDLVSPLSVSLALIGIGRTSPRRDTVSYGTVPRPRAAQLLVVVAQGVQDAC